MVEKCREIEQASRIAFNIMIDEKKQRGIFKIFKHLLCHRY